MGCEGSVVKWVWSMWDLGVGWEHGGCRSWAGSMGGCRSWAGSMGDVGVGLGAGIRWCWQ